MIGVALLALAQVGSTDGPAPPLALRQLRRDGEVVEAWFERPMEPGTDGPPRQRMQVQFHCGAREFRVLAIGFVQPDGTFLSLKRTMPDKDGPVAPDDVPFQPLDGGSMNAMYEATCAAR